MSTPSKRRPSNVDLILSILAIFIAAFALFIAVWNDKRVSVKLNPDPQRVDEAAILERANDSVNFANSLLGFLEGVSIIASVIIAAGTVIVRNSVQKQIEDAREFEEKTLERFEAREHELDELEKEFAARLQQNIELTRQEIAGVQEQARVSFRVISLVLLAEQQVRAHNIDTAIQSLEEAFALEPENHAVNYLLGYLYTSRKMLPEAIKHLDHALAVDPDFYPAVAARGLALRRMGDSLKDPKDQMERDELWSQAETELVRALREDEHLIDADGESYFGTLGGLYRRRGLYPAALQAYTRARDITPNSSYPISNLAILYQHEGQQKEANDFFEQVRKMAEQDLTKDPRNDWRRADYALAKLVLGDREGALSELRTILAANTKQSSLVQTFRETLQFLAESPNVVPGLDEMIRQLDRA